MTSQSGEDGSTSSKAVRLSSLAMQVSAPLVSKIRTISTRSFCNKFRSHQYTRQQLRKTFKSYVKNAHKIVYAGKNCDRIFIRRENWCVFIPSHFHCQYHSIGFHPISLIICQDIHLQNNLCHFYA